jgi:hypothetical protein
MRTVSVMPWHENHWVAEDCPRTFTDSSSFAVGIATANAGYEKVGTCIDWAPPRTVDSRRLFDANFHCSTRRSRPWCQIWAPGGWIPLVGAESCIYNDYEYLTNFTCNSCVSMPPESRRMPRAMRTTVTGIETHSGWMLDKKETRKCLFPKCYNLPDRGSCRVIES